MAAVSALAFGESAQACKCGGERTLLEARSASAFVVTGVIRAVHPAVISGARIRAGGVTVPWPVSIVEVIVTRSISGAAPRTIELTHNGCCACEAKLDVGHEYLLFVLASYEVRDAYMVSYCYPNRRIEQAGQFLRQLPAGVAYATANHTSFLAQLRWRSEAFGNVLARMYVKRAGNSPFIKDPLLSIKGSPWTPFAAWLFAGLVVGIAVVSFRRRRRRGT
jgi:hypothetical protein